MVGKHNNVFSKLPKLVQKAIKGRKVIVSEYTQIDYKGLSDVFVNVNSGVPLNAQELRNALHTAWAAYVRQMRKELAPLLIKMFGNKYKKRLVGDEWIVDAIDMVLNNYCKDEKLIMKSMELLKHQRTNFMLVTMMNSTSRRSLKTSSLLQVTLTR